MAVGGTIVIRTELDERQTLRSLNTLEREARNTATDIEQSFNRVDSEIDVEINVDDSQVDEANRRIERLDSDVGVDVNVDDSQIDEANRQIQNLNTTATVRVEVDDDSLQGISETVSEVAGSADLSDGAGIGAGALAGAGVGALGAVALAGAGVAAAAAAAGVGAGLGKSVSVVNEFTEAENILASMTGKAGTELEKLSDVANGMYLGNYGENVQEMANLTGTIANATGLAGNELQTFVQRAVEAQEIFDLPMSESILGAKTLMTQFGYSASQAFSLMAQGAKQGLNQNEDLGSQLAEFSVYYKQLGYSGEEMMNMLANATKAGVYQLDYPNTAIQEFGIKTKDNSEAVADAFTKMGFNSKEMFARFAQDGEIAQQASFEVIDALKNMDDKVLQNELAVTLFGTKWEDAGMKAIFALTDINGTITDTKDEMDGLADIRFDDVFSLLASLGRKIEFEVFKPIGESLEPLIKNAIAGLDEMVNSGAIDDMISILTDFFGSEIVAQIMEDLNQFGISTLEVFNQLATELKPVFEDLSLVISDIIQEVSQLFSENSEQMISIIVQTLALLVPIFSQIAILTLEMVSQMLPLLLQAMVELLPLISDIILTLLPYAVQIIEMLIPIIIEVLESILPGIIELLKTLIPWILNVAEIILTVLIGNLSLLFPVIETIIKYLGSLVNAFNAVLQFIEDVFTIGWEQAWNNLEKAMWRIFFNIQEDGIECLFTLCDNWINGVTNLVNKINEIFGTNIKAPEVDLSSAKQAIRNSLTAMKKEYLGGAVLPQSQFTPPGWTGTISEFQNRTYKKQYNDDFVPPGLREALDKLDGMSNKDFLKQYNDDFMRPGYMGLQEDYKNHMDKVTSQGLYAGERANNITPTNSNFTYPQSSNSSSSSSSSGSGGSGGGGNAGIIHVYLNLDGQIIYDKVVDLNEMHTIATGVNLLA